jgi:hypothetical protein
MKIIKYFKLFESVVLNYLKQNWKILKDNCKDFNTTPKLLQRDKTKIWFWHSYINLRNFTREQLMMSDGDVVFSNAMLVLDIIPY